MDSKTMHVIFGQIHLVMAGLVSCYCPCHFRFHRNVNCSSLNLSRVPNCIPNNTRVLYLNDNMFQSVNSDEFTRFLRLKKLYFERNKLTKLEICAFRGLDKLEELSLASNNLKYSDSYPVDVFKPLKSLRKLSLQGNCNSRVEINCSYPEEALMFANNLEYLNIDGIKDVPLGKGFAALRRLNHLQMSQENARSSYCYLPQLKRDYFLSLSFTPITSLQLLHCDTELVEQNVFSSQRNLTALTIIGNPTLCESGLLNISSGLNATSIRNVTFSEWCQGPDAMLYIRPKLSHLFKNTFLESLQLTSMRILYVDLQFLQDIPISLHELSFRNCSLTDIGFCNSLWYLPNLSKLDISAQSKHFSITGSQQKDYESHKNRGHFPYFHGEIKIQAFQALYLTRFIHIKILNISFNNIELSQQGFSGLNDIRELFLQGNNFGKNIMNHENVFCDLRQLEILNLSENSIRNLPSKIFQTLESLQYLYLSKNSLRNISVSFIDIVHLKYIDLSHNELQIISDENLLHFSKINSLTLSIHGNNLPCSSTNHDVIDWLSKHPRFIKYPLKCIYEDDSVINVKSTDEVMNRLLYKCILAKWLCIVTTLLVFLSLITASVVLFYHKRWKLKYLCSVSRKTLNPYHPIQGNNITLDIDIYISYDMDFLVEPNYCLHKIVTTNIVPVLSSCGRVVKIREDIIPGRPVTSEIADVIRRSKKIVIFISSGYTFDFINTFEFDTSVIEGVFTRRDAIIVVAVGDVNNMDLKPEVMVILRGKVQENDVIYFPKDFIRNKELFLQQLEAKLNM